MTISGRTVEAADICPHGKPLGKCREAWCQARIEDLKSGHFNAKVLQAPETVEEIAVAEAIQPKSETSWRDHLDEIEAIGFAVKPPRKSPGPSGSIWCLDCGKWWTGHRPEHCTVCHETFSGETAGNLHRHGKFSPADDRRCHTTEWMRGKGWWQDDQDIWRLPKPHDNPFRRADVEALAAELAGERAS